jgi:antitoxin (DNA-binding transcriptional repressor) of toxin-antitoxin stability system
MTKMAATAVRDAFGDTVNRVAFKGERIVLERHGKAVAALVSVEDLSLLEDLEDRADLEEARRALQDPERIPYEEIRRKTGLV